MADSTSAPDEVQPAQCAANHHCVLTPGHTDYCLDERPLFEELTSITGSGPDGLGPGDTLSHRTAAACVRFGWARRNADGNFEITPRGRAVALFAPERS